MCFSVILKVVLEVFYIDVSNVSDSSKLLGSKCLSKTITFLTVATNVIESFILRFFKK